MGDPRRRLLGGASGIAAVVAGAVGGALERGWPDGDDPVAVAAFIAEHRDAILGQSACFLLSSAFYLIFLGGLRGVVARDEPGDKPLASTAFAGGVAWVTLSMMAQAVQVGLTLAASSGVAPAMMATMAATFGIANLPCAVMLAAVAVASFRHAAFPAWLGGISALGAVAQVLLWTGTFATRGPLAPNGWLTYVLYPLFLVWLVPTIVVMLRAPKPLPASRLSGR